MGTAGYRHGLTPRRGELWACEFPERPADGRTRYYEGCPACLIALRGALQVQGDMLMGWVDDEAGTVSVRPILASQAIETWSDDVR